MKGFHLTHEAGETYTQTLLRVFDTEGETPLHKAARNGHTAIIELILEYQPRVDQATRSNDIRYLDWRESANDATSLHLASGGGHLDAVKVLVAHGAEVEAQTWDGGQTALHFATQYGHLDVVEFLVGQGANIETRTRDLEWTALHFAAAEGHEAVVVWLLKNGASPYAAIDDGTEALQLAAQRGYDGVVRALLKFDYKKLGFGADNTEMADLIVEAAMYKQDTVLRDLLARFEEGHLKEILHMGEVEKYHRALDVAKALSSSSGDDFRNHFRNRTGE